MCSNELEMSWILHIFLVKKYFPYRYFFGPPLFWVQDHISYIYLQIYPRGRGTELLDMSPKKSTSSLEKSRKNRKKYESLNCRRGGEGSRFLRKPFFCLSSLKDLHKFSKILGREPWRGGEGSRLAIEENTFFCLSSQR